MAFETNPDTSHWLNPELHTCQLALMMLLLFFWPAVRCDCNNRVHCAVLLVVHHYVVFSHFSYRYYPFDQASAGCLLVFAGAVSSLLFPFPCLRAPSAHALHLPTHSI